MAVAGVTYTAVAKVPGTGLVSWASDESGMNSDAGSGTGQSGLRFEAIVTPSFANGYSRSWRLTLRDLSEHGGIGDISCMSVDSGGKLCGSDTAGDTVCQSAEGFTPGSCFVVQIGHGSADHTARMWKQGDF